MNDLRLTYGGTEFTLAALGIAQAQLVRNLFAPGTLMIRIPGAAAVVANDAIAYGTQVILKDHTLSGSPVIFAGRRTDQEDIADPKNPGITITFSDAWWDLQHGAYLTEWQVPALSGGVITYTASFSPRVWLFMNTTSGGTPWTYWTAAAQIGDIIDFAHTFYGTAIQAGTIDPVITMPVMPVTNQTMADCIQIMLRTLPDQTSGFNYTTTPPSLNIRARQNCTPITLPFADGVKHSSSRIKRRPDLQVPQVVVQYQTTVAGTGFNTFSQDVYPPGSTGDVLQSLFLQFDLRGPQRNYVQGQITATAFDPTNVSFWEDIKPDLDLDNIDSLTIIDTTINASSGHPFGITIEDAVTGAAVPISGSGALPNILSPKSSVASWMMAGSTQIVAKEVKITAYVNYTKTTADGHATETNVTNHPVTYRCKLTNSAAGAVTYKQLASAIAAEQPPPFFAYTLWCALNNVALNLVSGVPTPPGSVPSLTSPDNLQWEGWHRIVEKNISAYYDCTNTLNLSGGNADWETMNAKIYRVAYDLFQSATEITFGAHKHPTPQQWWELQTMAQMRLAWDNPNIPSQGLDPTGAGVQTPNDNEVSNTSEQHPTRATDGLVGPVSSGTYWASHHDAGSGVGVYDGDPAWLVRTLKTSDGSIDTTFDQINARISQLIGTTPCVIKWKCVTGCDSSGNPIYRYVLASQQFSGSPPGGADVT